MHKTYFWMKKFGYIVSKTKINNLKGFVELVDDISLADSTKPILVVGYKEAKSICPNEKFNILEKSIGDNMFWTFKKTESRVDFDRDINWFYKYVINNILDKIKYYYINVYNLKYNKIKKLYKILFSNDKKYIYISKGMIYFLYEKKSILGISLRMLNYAGISSKKVISKLKSNPSNIFYDDDYPLVVELKKDIGNKKYAMPYFISEEE